jgi:hypothetical protein
MARLTLRRQPPTPTSPSTQYAQNQPSTPTQGETLTKEERKKLGQAIGTYQSQITSYRQKIAYERSKGAKANQQRISEQEAALARDTREYERLRARLEQRGVLRQAESAVPRDYESYKLAGTTTNQPRPGKPITTVTASVPAPTMGYVGAGESAGGRYRSPEPVTSTIDESTRDRIYNVIYPRNIFPTRVRPKGAAERAGTVLLVQTERAQNIINEDPVISRIPEPVKKVITGPRLPEQNPLVGTFKLGRYLTGQSDSLTLTQESRYKTGMRSAGEFLQEKSQSSIERGDTSRMTRFAYGLGAEMRERPGRVADTIALNYLGGKGVGYVIGKGVTKIPVAAQYFGYTAQQGVKAAEYTEAIGGGALAVGVGGSLALTPAEDVGRAAPGLVAGGVGFGSGYARGVGPKGIIFGQERPGTTTTTYKGNDVFVQGETSRPYTQVKYGVSVQGEASIGQTFYGKQLEGGAYIGKTEAGALYADIYGKPIYKTQSYGAVLKNGIIAAETPQGIFIGKGARPVKSPYGEYFSDSKSFVVSGSRVKEITYRSGTQSKDVLTGNKFELIDLGGEPAGLFSPRQRETLFIGTEQPTGFEPGRPIGSERGAIGRGLRLFEETKGTETGLKSFREVFEEPTIPTQQYYVSGLGPRGSSLVKPEETSFNPFTETAKPRFSEAPPPLPSYAAFSSFDSPFLFKPLPLIQGKSETTPGVRSLPQTRSFTEVTPRQTVLPGESFSFKGTTTPREVTTPLITQRQVPDLTPPITSSPPGSPGFTPTPGLEVPPLPPIGGGFLFIGGFLGGKKQRSRGTRSKTGFTRSLEAIEGVDFGGVSVTMTPTQGLSGFERRGKRKKKTKKRRKK